MTGGIRRILGDTVGRIPVRIRRGIAKGARWTLFPWTAYWRGAHEPAVQEAIGQLGNGSISGWCCWDLGAHFGYYSVALALKVGPEGQVVAFEPNPHSNDRLNIHRRMNGLAWLKTYRFAVSDQTGTAELLTYGGVGSTDAHLPYEGETLGAVTKPITISTLRPDDLVERGEIRSPQFVKIDVEGHGHRALLGMQRSISTSRPFLIVAFHSMPEVEGVVGILEPLGYVWKPLDGYPSDRQTMVGRDYLFTPAPDNESRSRSSTLPS
jgi:FkbM family methyltransferase